MYEFFNKRGLTVFALLGAVLTLITVFTLAGGDETAMDVERFSAGTNFGLRSIYIIGIACGLLALALPIVNSLGEPKKLLKPIVGIAAIGVVFLICWAASSGDFDVAKFGPETDFDLTESGSKFVGGMLNTTYVLAVLAVIAIIGSSVMKLFK